MYTYTYGRDRRAPYLPLSSSKTIKHFFGPRLRSLIVRVSIRVFNGGASLATTRTVTGLTRTVQKQRYPPRIFDRIGVVKFLGVICEIRNYGVIELYMRNKTETS